MPQYTTGELAKLCNITVRTVQFYDTKDLLKPSELTEGGRRLYSDDDLNRLRFICMLKALGLTLGTIKGTLDSDNSTKVLLLLLDEQAKQIDGEIQDRQKQLESIKVVKDNIHSTGKITVNSIRDIEHIMESKKVLKKTHLTMLAVGLLMDVILVVTVIIWIAKGLWLPFAIGMSFVILMGVMITRMYYMNTEYICAECNTKFRPVLSKFLFSNHTPKTRKLTCPHCGYTGYCVEIGAERES
jgi:DNA-binding transcriptional MerR regulator/DNA-directed RNA polymerase subunit RPC12/RpoP